MFTVFFRGVILYMLIFAALRLLGKRQIAQLQPHELALTLLIAELAAGPMANTGEPMLHGILPILALLALNALLTIINFKSEKVRRVLNGAPSVIVRQGVIDAAELNRQAYDLNSLMESIRLAGVESPADVAYAVLETGGGLSVFPISQKRPLTPKDLQIETQADRVPLSVILDGRIQTENMRVVGLSDDWLSGVLKECGLAARDVLYALIDGRGGFIAQAREKGSQLIYQPNSVNPGVIW